MGAHTKRYRDANGDIATLDLTSADAEDRRFDLDPATTGAKSIRLIGFDWTASTAQARNITIQRVDKQNSDQIRKLEERLGDTSTSGTWRPVSEEVAGYDPDEADSRDDAGTIFRIQFSQTADACLVHVSGTYKEV